MNSLLFIRKQPKPVYFLLGVLGVLILGLIDWALGPEFSITFFYVAPVFLICLIAGQWAGILLALISAAVWAAADLLSGHHYPNPWLFYWSMAAHLVLFGVGVWLSTLKNDTGQSFPRTDNLTQAVNREYFFESAEFQIGRLEKDLLPFAVACINIDNFKAFNDQFGHRAGDDLLKKAARLILSNLRPTDVAARLGSDEFGVLLPESDPETARMAMQKLYDVLTGQIRKEHPEVTFSVGVAVFNASPGSADAMFRFADDLMRIVKNTTKNNIHFKVIESAEEINHCR